MVQEGRFLGRIHYDRSIAGCSKDVWSGTALNPPYHEQALTCVQKESQRCLPE